MSENMFIVSEEGVLDFIKSHFDENYSLPILVKDIGNEVIIKINGESLKLEWSTELDLESKLILLCFRQDIDLINLAFLLDFNDPTNLEDTTYDLVNITASGYFEETDMYDIEFFIPRDEMLSFLMDNDIVTIEGTDVTETTLMELKKRDRARKTRPKSTYQYKRAKANKLDPSGHRKRSRAAKMRWRKYGSKIKRGISKFKKSAKGKKLSKLVGIVRRKK